MIAQGDIQACAGLLDFDLGHRAYDSLNAAYTAQHPDVVLRCGGSGALTIGLWDVVRPESGGGVYTVPLHQAAGWTVIQRGGERQGASEGQMREVLGCAETLMIRGGYWGGSESVWLRGVGVRARKPDKVSV